MHWLKIRVGAWQFAPALWPTLAALFFLILTVSLGNWQSERADIKRALQARYDAAVREPPVHIGGTLLGRDEVLYRKLEVAGVFDDAHTILLDNRVMNGVAGYHVLTPLRIDGGPLAILVNRGWVAVGLTREQVPKPPTPAGRVELEGLAVDLHSRFVELAATAPQGRVWQNLDVARYAEISGLTLQPVLLQQTSDGADGLLRNWPRPDTGVATHVSYAIQWYGLATTLTVLWLVLNVRRHRGGHVESTP
ncbi:MAG: SURF1 family protein [Thiobacillus sp.]|uniref:SURF1 family protein n=1 Tax=Thiobacillus sp. TaxID=924 RepID=UPI0028943209|nr:SURF1 family protein [Thiobacillus sp.]MDT3706838.1 SURF1 family protein [Thiobacillus sp.]